MLADKGRWKNLLAELMRELDLEWLMIDASHAKTYCHAADVVGGNQAIDLKRRCETPRYSWPWMLIVCRCESLLQQVPRRIACGLMN